MCFRVFTALYVCNKYISFEAEVSAAVLLLFSVILNSFPVVYPAEGKAGFFLINRMENNMPFVHLPYYSVRG